MAKLRLGIIGAGAWTVASHLPNLARRADDVEFVAVCRHSRPELERIREQYGFAIASEDYRDVLAAGVDICVVASPAALHYEHARAALQSGAAVLLEKPVTIDPGQAWDLEALANRLHRDVVVAYGWNYQLPVRQAKQLLQSGKGIGSVEQLMISMSFAMRDLLSNSGTFTYAGGDAAPGAATWADPELSGGGFGQAQLSHALGLALWLTGLRGAEVYAAMSSPYGSGVELHDAIVVRYDNGAIGTLSGASGHWGAEGNKHHMEVRVVGAGGQMLVDLGREAVWLFNSEYGQLKLDLEPNAGLYTCEGPIDALVDRALGRPVENCSPLELGARSVEILAAAYRSSRSGRPENVLDPTNSRGPDDC